MKKTENIYQVIVRITPTVAHILKKNKGARDDDNLLCTLVWKIQGMKNNSQFRTFRNNLLKGRYSTPESITRCRRKLQEHNEELRGKLYASRHEMEAYMLNQLKLEFDF